MAADKERGTGTASAEIGKYLDILAKDPNSRVFAPLAEAYRKVGLVEDAIATALEGLKVHPNYLGGRVALGRAYFEKGQYAEAAAEMLRVVKSAPDNLMAHRVLGQIAIAQHDATTAEKAFRMVLLLDPGDQEARQHLESVRPAAPAAAAAPAPPRLMEPEAGEFPGLPLRALEGHVLTAPSPPELLVEPVEPPPAFDSIPFAEPLPVEDRADQPATPPEAIPAVPEESAPELDALPPEGLATESPLDFVDQGDLSAPPAASPIPAEPAQEPPADAGLELEIFTRVTGGVDRRRGVQLEDDELAPYREITLDDADQDLEPGEPQLNEESPFEIFTRESFVPSSSPAGVGDEPAGRELEIETTAYMPPENFADDLGALEAPQLPTRTEGEEAQPEAAQELAAEPEPDIERATSELECASAPEPAAPSPPIAEEPLFERSPDLEAHPAPESAQPAETPPEPEPTAAFELEPEPMPAPEVVAPPAQELRESEVPTEEPQPASPQALLPDMIGDESETWVEEEPSTPAGPGVFDTETLAAIYVNQGFYGRAADIYQRLSAQHPGDAGLRRKLEEARELELGAGRGKQTAASAVPPPAAAPAAATVPVEVQLDRLQRLLEAFMEARPE